MYSYMTIHRNDYRTFITYYNKRHPLKVKKKNLTTVTSR